MQSDKCKKKEADATAIATTSRGLCGNKTYIHDSGKGGVCQLPPSKPSVLPPPSGREVLEDKSEERREKRKGANALRLI